MCLWIKIKSLAMFVWEGHIFKDFSVIFGSFARINLRDWECQNKNKILKYSSHQTQVHVYYEEDFLLLCSCSWWHSGNSPDKRDLFWSVKKQLREFSLAVFLSYKWQTFLLKVSSCAAHDISTLATSRVTGNSIF